MDANWTSALHRALHAPFLAHALERRADLGELLADGQGEAALLLAKQSRDADVATALRRERLGLALVLAVGDLAGAFDLKVMRELSTFADRALRSAGSRDSQRVPDPNRSG